MAPKPRLARGFLPLRIFPIRAKVLARLRQVLAAFVISIASLNTGVDVIEAKVKFDAMSVFPDVSVRFRC